METSAVTNNNITVLTVKLGRQNCLAPRSIGKRSSDIKFSVPIAVACAVLHNFCIKMGHDWDDDGNPDHHCRDDDNEDKRHPQGISLTLFCVHYILRFTMFILFQFFI